MVKRKFSISFKMKFFLIYFADGILSKLENLLNSLLHEFSRLQRNASGGKVHEIPVVQHFYGRSSAHNSLTAERLSDEIYFNKFTRKRKFFK